jgi:hypothetical protein
MRRPIKTAAVVASITMLAGIAYGQSSSAADQIRQRVAEYDREGSDRSAMALKDVVVWTGASSKPLTKEGDKPDLVAPNRRNQVFKTTVQRIEVSQSADMAYEYSTFTLSYDDDRGHTNATGALVRVWKKDGTAWKIAIQFQRPYGDIRPLLSTGR